MPTLIKKIAYKISFEILSFGFQLIAAFTLSIIVIGILLFGIVVSVVMIFLCIFFPELMANIKGL